MLLTRSPQKVMSNPDQREHPVFVDYMKELTEDDGHVDEKVAEWTTVGRHELRSRRTPPRRIRRASEDILWNRSAVE